jgi:hypothetical protein
MRTKESQPGDAQHPVGQHLIVVHDVEVGAPAPQGPQRAQAEGQRLGEGTRPHRRDLQDVDPVAELAQPWGAERVFVGIQVQAGEGAQLRAWFEVGIGLAGEDLDVVPERVEFAGQVPQVDPLATAVRLAPVGEQRDPQWAC